MKHLNHLGLAAGAAVLSGLAGCQSQAPHARDHWTGYSIGPRVSRAFLGYEAETDGNYRDFQWRKKKDIEMTIRRHFFNHNPENPFEAVDDSVYEPRPLHAPLPAAHRYIHAEGLAFGAILYASGGIFFPVPVDSILGTFEEGGTEEAFEGLGQFVRPVGVLTASFLHDTLGFPETAGDDWRH